MSLLLTLDIYHTFIVNFEQVNVGCENTQREVKEMTVCMNLKQLQKIFNPLNINRLVSI